MLMIYAFLILHTTQVISTTNKYDCLNCFGYVYTFFLYYYSLMELYSFEYSFNLNVILSDDDYKI